MKTKVILENWADQSVDICTYLPILLLLHTQTSLFNTSAIGMHTKLACQVNLSFTQPCLNLTTLGNLCAVVMFLI